MDKSIIKDVNIPMLSYTAKILKITHIEGNENKLTSPHRESKNLPISTYDTIIEAEIISVKGYGTDTDESSRSAQPGFFGAREYQIKTSLMTTIGFRSLEEVEKYRKQHHIEKNSPDLETIITYHRLRDLSVGELITFSYPYPENSQKDYNPIRYQNKPLTISDFKSKSYPAKIDNMVEDSAVRHNRKSIGLGAFKKIKTPVWKGIWFRLQAKYRFLIRIKQTFYRKRSRWEITKFVIVVMVTIISIAYSLNPEFLKEPEHKFLFIIVALVNMLKELF